MATPQGRRPPPTQGGGSGLLSKGDDRDLLGLWGDEAEEKGHSEVSGLKGGAEWNERGGVGGGRGFKLGGRGGGGGGCLVGSYHFEKLSSIKFHNKPERSSLATNLSDRRKYCCRRCWCASRLVFYFYLAGKCQLFDLGAESRHKVMSRYI